MQTKGMRMRRYEATIGGILLLLVAILIAAFSGMLLGLQPRFAIVLLVPLAAFAALWLGVRFSRRAVNVPGGWQSGTVLVFWMLTINMPVFLSFDTSGFTRDHGLFNVQSLSRITLFLSGATASIVFWLLWSRNKELRTSGRPVAGAWFLFSLYLWYLVQAPIVASGLSLALAIFRVSEWLLAFALLYIAFTIQNARGQRAVGDRLRLVIPMLQFLLLSVLLLLLVSPERAYQRSAVTGIARLGGLFTHPNLLALVVSVLFSYAISYWTGWRRLLFAIGCAVVLVLTYSRGGFAAFALTCIAGLLIAIRHAGLRLVGVLFIALAALTVSRAPALLDEAEVLLNRGSQTQSLGDLSERTAVWAAAKTLIARSPWLGEGFITGPKLLGEEMVRERLSYNFAAVHAHNEILQAQISGGILAALLSIGIHLRVLYLLFRAPLQPRESFVLWTIMINVLVWGLLTPSLSYLLTLPGVLLGWLLLTLEGLARPDARVAPAQT